MPMNAKSLGIMKPLGGGDPIPLLKEELLIGRRPTCDIHLDYERVSGKHCVLRMIKGVWHIRDLASTNGTTVNGQKIDHEHSLMPDDEFGVAGHLFMIDYDPLAPTQVMAANQVLEEELVEGQTRKRHSLLELAGLETDYDHRAGPGRGRPERAPERIVRPKVDEADFDDAISNQLPDAPAPAVTASDEDFFKMIQGDLDSDSKSKKGKK
jgi:hypothetical protein